MKRCKTHLFNCLKSIDVHPTANSESIYDERHKPENALVYDGNDFFASNPNSPNQWWSIDFKLNVLITGYQISAGTRCNWLNSWTIFLSENGTNWVDVSTQSDYPGNTKYPVKYNVPIRYFKIQGKCNCHYELAFYYIKYFGYYTSLNGLWDTCAKRRRDINPLLIVFQMIST